MHTHTQDLASVELSPQRRGWLPVHAACAAQSLVPDISKQHTAVCFIFIDQRTLEKRMRYVIPKRRQPKPQDRIITYKKTGTHEKHKKIADFQVKIRPGVFPNKVRHADRLDHDGRLTVTAPPPARITATRKRSNFG